MRCLVVEDLSYKRNKVVDFIEKFSCVNLVDTALSYSSALKKITDNSYAFVVIDMSLPSVDKTETESGGRFREFGGRDIIRKMKRIGRCVHFVILTQFTSFIDKGEILSLEKIEDEIRGFYGEFFLGIIHYDATNSEWKDRLSVALQRVGCDD